MSTNITIVIRSKPHPGKKEELIKVLQELTDYCIKTEDGQLSYDWYLSSDEETCYVIETYKNEAAVLFHGQNYQPFAERLNACRTNEDMKVFGNISNETSALLKTMNAEIYTRIAGRE